MSSSQSCQVLPDTNTLLSIFAKAPNPVPKPKSSRRCGECRAEERILPGKRCKRCAIIRKLNVFEETEALARALFDVPGWSQESINSASYFDHLLWVSWGEEQQWWYCMDRNESRWYIVGKDKKAGRKYWVPFLGATNAVVQWSQEDYLRRVGDVSALAWKEQGPPKALLKTVEEERRKA